MKASAVGGHFASGTRRGNGVCHFKLAFPFMRSQSACAIVLLRLAPCECIRSEPDQVARMTTLEKLRLTVAPRP